LKEVNDVNAYNLADAGEHGGHHTVVGSDKNIHHSISNLIINFIHNYSNLILMVDVPFICKFTLTKSKTKNKDQLYFSHMLGQYLKTVISSHSPHLSQLTTLTCHSFKSWQPVVSINETNKQLKTGQAKPSINSHLFTISMYLNTLSRLIKWCHYTSILGFKSLPFYNTQC
jgi:hypothetical protein